MGSAKLSKKRVTLRRLAKRRTHFLSGQAEPDVLEVDGEPSGAVMEALRVISRADRRQTEESLVGV